MAMVCSRRQHDKMTKRNQKKQKKYKAKLE